MAKPGEVFQATPVSYGGGRVIASPFQFSLTDDDNLQIVSANSLVGVALTIQGRRLSPAGTIEPFSFLHVPLTDRSTRTENFKIGAGSLLNLTIFANSGAPKIGQTYVMARLIRGLSAATILLGGVLGGYVTSTQALAYPGSPIQSALEGGGFVRTIAGTTPAAGTDISETVPNSARWELLTLFAIFTTSAAAGNRIAQLVVNVGAAIKLLAPSNALQAPAAALAYDWGTGLVNTVRADNGAFAFPFPSGLSLLAGEVLRTGVIGFDAADQWTAPIYTVREWLEVN